MMLCALQSLAMHYTLTDLLILPLKWLAKVFLFLRAAALSLRRLRSLYLLADFCIFYFFYILFYSVMYDIILLLLTCTGRLLPLSYLFLYCVHTTDAA